jgi:hypothetical protein
MSGSFAPNKPVPVARTGFINAEPRYPVCRKMISSVPAMAIGRTSLVPRFFVDRLIPIFDRAHEMGMIAIAIKNPQRYLGCG